LQPLIELAQARGEGRLPRLMTTLERTRLLITLSSDKNGNVTGTLTIPGRVIGVIPDNLACVEISWTNTTLNFSGQTVPIVDVSQQFDSTGSFCNSPFP
jgi:hypothetical protein